MPPTRMSHTELSRQRNRATVETIASPSVTTSTNDVRPSCQLTFAMSASDPTFTPSRNAAATLDLRIRGMTGPLAATSRNAGAKMPIVATTEPRTPPNRYPTESRGSEYRTRCRPKGFAEKI